MSAPWTLTAALEAAIVGIRFERAAHHGIPRADTPIPLVLRDRMFADVRGAVDAVLRADAQLHEARDRLDVRAVVGAHAAPGANVSIPALPLELDVLQHADRRPERSTVVVELCGAGDLNGDEWEQLGWRIQGELAGRGIRVERTIVIVVDTP